MRDPIEFTVGAHTYRATPMDAKTQQHVGRRIQPLLIAVIPSIQALAPVFQAAIVSKKKADGAAGDTSDASALDFSFKDLLSLDLNLAADALLGPLNLLAQMSDETYDYVQAKCLARVQRKREGDTGWITIWGTQSERLLDDSLSGDDSAAIMMKVLVAELGPFFFGLVSKMLGPSQI